VGDNTTILWRDFDPGNGGLRLTLLNALDDDWTEEFELAVADWQESDALVLSTERVEVDHTCQSKDGVMVVCNANFGETGWVGINENSIVNDRIVASVSKMNEYYLKNSNLDHRRYTMCHEVSIGLFVRSRLAWCVSGGVEGTVFMSFCNVIPRLFSGSEISLTLYLGKNAIHDRSDTASDSPTRTKIPTIPTSGIA